MQESEGDSDAEDDESMEDDEDIEEDEEHNSEDENPLLVKPKANDQDAKMKLWFEKACHL